MKATAPRCITPDRARHRAAALVGIPRGPSGRFRCCATPGCGISHERAFRTSGRLLYPYHAKCARCRQAKREATA